MKTENQMNNYGTGIKPTILRVTHWATAASSEAHFIPSLYRALLYEKSLVDTNRVKGSKMLYSSFRKM